MTNKYSIKDLRHDFPGEKECVEFIFDTLHTRKCSCGGVYKQLEGRRQFQCSKCRFQIAPTSGTIFHKSSTPLTLWFYAIFIFSSSKSGISAKGLQRQLGVTYKCAWRMLTLIRGALKQDKKLLRGDVESDQAYFGGVYKAGANNKNLKASFAAKSAVMGAVERGGKMRVKVIPDMTAETINKFLKENVETEAGRLLTDKSKGFSRAWGYARYSVDHNRGEYVRGDIYVNNIEAFWSHLKRSIKGTHKVISRKYLQSYLDGFVFHYNNRYSDKGRFSALLGALLQPAS